MSHDGTGGVPLLTDDVFPPRQLLPRLPRFEEAEACAARGTFHDKHSFRIILAKF